MKTSRSQDPIFPVDATTSPSKRPTVSVDQTPPSKPRPFLQDSPSQQSVGRSMSNYEDIRRLHTGPAPQETTPGKVRPLNPPDYHHAMQSRLVALKSPELQTASPSRKSPSSTRSEDELSAASSSGNSLSPRSRRRHSNNNHKNTASSSNPGTLTPSSGSSRNQSPRLLVEARLKSNANGSVTRVEGNTNGGNNSGLQGLNKRASTNLQEELLRLISPDTVDEEEPSVILTHARPVAVQSSSTDAMANELPDAEEMDWSRLVHAAARAIQGAASSISSTQEEDEDEDVVQHLHQEPERQSPIGDASDNQDSLTSWIDDVTEKLRLEAEAAVSAAAAANNSPG